MLKLKLPGECGNRWRREGDRCWPVLIRRRRMSPALRFIQASLELQPPLTELLFPGKRMSVTWPRRARLCSRSKAALITGSKPPYKNPKSTRFICGIRSDVQIDALGPQELAGTVVEIVPASDPASRTYLVKISITLPSGNQQIIRSGLYGKARFITGQTQAITIPQKAVVENGQLTSVYVVDQSGIARMRLVKTGKTYAERVEMLSGLKEGEQIVVDGVAAVNDGSRVREAAPGFLPAATK